MYVKIPGLAELWLTSKAESFNLYPKHGALPRYRL